ncbi:MAG TPA: glycosyl hydrolase family 28-related protein [Terriglobia bacterium]|nr:glycosyl hydrolase family 28-related protein [Terriglobia bacterium]
MKGSNTPFLSRRRWLGLAAPILAASLDSCGSNEGGLAAQRIRPVTPSETLATRVYNIRDFGAVGDGKTLDRAAVQASIDTCSKDRGGTVLVPAGMFVIGTVELKSNVTLHIAPQGTLLGSADGKQYHAAAAIPLEGDTTLRDGNVGLIFAVNANNVTVEGPGTIDGQGAQFRSSPTASELGAAPAMLLAVSGARSWSVWSGMTEQSKNPHAVGGSNTDHSISNVGEKLIPLIPAPTLVAKSDRTHPLPLLPQCRHGHWPPWAC